jgi:hypothetical protein
MSKSISTYVSMTYRFKAAGPCSLASWGMATEGVQMMKSPVLMTLVATVSAIDLSLIQFTLNRTGMSEEV